VDLKTKRESERAEEIEKRKKDVIKAAREVFLQKGIDKAKMTDIAAGAGVGVASVYRYFATKTDLLLEVAVDYWESEKEYIDTILIEQGPNDNLNGYKKVKKLLGIFQHIYTEQPNFLKFLEMFDNHIIREGVPFERLELYEISALSFKPLIFNAIEQGKNDGSIRKDVDAELFYMTTAHALMSLSQKLLLRGSVLRTDRTVEGLEQIKLLSDMAVKYIWTDTMSLTKEV
jgi:AcrR family transcriptional regulator